MEAQIWLWLGEHAMELASVGVAAAAWYLAYHEVRMADRHNRLSVRPYLVLDFSAPYREPVTVYLVNRGAGPAIIARAFLVVRDEEFAMTRSGREQALSLLGLVLPCHGMTFDGEDAIAAGETRILLRFDTAADSKEDAARIRRLLPGLEFGIAGTDIYGEAFPEIRGSMEGDEPEKRDQRRSDH